MITCVTNGAYRARLLAIFAAGIVLAAITMSARAIASDEIDICAHYTETGRSYHVNGISAMGYELNQATRSANYKQYGRYVVIFWAQDQASVIEMDPSFSTPMSYAISGTDQYGRSWRISYYLPATCLQ
jgi:hypothetical protein